NPNGHISERSICSSGQNIHRCRREHLNCCRGNFRSISWSSSPTR
ncbi:unnamed protein product, partial [Allacma fusca]